MRTPAAGRGGGGRRHRLQRHRGLGEIVLHAEIGEALGGSGGEAARDMLAANDALRERPGAVLCQDPETKAFAVIRSIPLKVAEPDVMIEAVGDLVKTAASWKERLGHQ